MLDLYDDIEFEYATSIADRARNLMTQHKVPPSPNNFELWFTYGLGLSPQLNKAIDILIANKRAFDPGTNRGLYKTYIDDKGDLSAGQEEISNHLHAVLTNARGFLARAMTDNRDHVAALGNVAEQMQESDVDPRAIIQDLIGELSKAVTRASSLETHFADTSKELDGIRARLAETERRSKTDPLTGLSNRLALDEFLRKAQIDAMESGQPLSVLLIDVDHFKAFNDNFGHQVGDQVLRLIAKVLREGVREGDLAARYGGEELIAVLPGADLHVCHEVAERIRQAISGRQITRRSTGEVLSSVSVSIGVAQFVPGEAIASLFERCDRALYAAKRSGRNRTVTEQALDSEVVAA